MSFHLFSCVKIFQINQVSEFQNEYSSFMIVKSEINITNEGLLKWIEIKYLFYKITWILMVSSDLF